MLEPIRENQSYGGLRATFLSFLGQVRIPLKIDVGFGDLALEATAADFPVLLPDFPSPTLTIYARETVVAEKVEAAVQLGLTNSRMKDFYDLMFLADRFSFDGGRLVRAITGTFKRRGTRWPTGLPAVFTDSFADVRKDAWLAFLNKSDPVASVSMDFAAVLRSLVVFVGEPIEAARREVDWNAAWLPGGPWKGG